MQALVDTQDWHDTRLLAGSDEPDEPLTEAEKASQWDESESCRVRLWDEMPRRGSFRIGSW